MSTIQEREAAANLGALDRVQRERNQLLERAEAVMDLLEKHGPSIVPHLIDTDENAGERLRQTILQVKQQKEKGL